MTINEIIELLITGDTVKVEDHQRAEVQRRLRDIKKNCTIVLSQIKNQ